MNTMINYKNHHFHFIIKWANSWGFFLPIGHWLTDKTPKIPKDGDSWYEISINAGLNKVIYGDWIYSWIGFMVIELIVDYGDLWIYGE